MVSMTAEVRVKCTRELCKQPATKRNAPATCRRVLDVHMLRGTQEARGNCLRDGQRLRNQHLGCRNVCVKDPDKYWQRSLAHVDAVLGVLPDGQH